MTKDNDLKQIKELLEIVAHKVDLMEVSRTGQSASFHLMKDQQSVMNVKLDDIHKDLEEVKETLLLTEREDFLKVLIQVHNLEN